MTANRLWALWREDFEQREGNLPQSYKEMLLAMKVPKKAQLSWEQLAYTMEEFLDGEAGLVAPQEMVKSVVMGLYEDYAQGQFTNADVRLEELKVLQGRAGQAVDLRGFLEEASLQAEAERKQDEEAEGVLLSSIHQAKGLEFPVVFVLWLAEGMFPSRRTVEAELEGHPQQMEEERRLFYVACTRAEDQLYLCYPAMWLGAWDGSMMQRPSRFLKEIGEDNLEEWVLTEEA